MRIYLIDYENVNSAGLHGIGQLPEEDRVILFYSQTASTISFEIMDEMMNGSVMPERICISHSGKNALDFQLSTLLGCLIAHEKADEYFIISRDGGFAAVVDFCKEHLHTNVQLRSSIKASLNVKSKAKTTAVSVRKRKTVVQVQPMTVTDTEIAYAQKNRAAEINIEAVQSLLPELGTESAQTILDCLLSCHSKTEYHNELQQHFPNDDVKGYYFMTKSLFSAAGY